MKILSKLCLFFLLLFPLLTRANDLSLMQNSEWMESVQLIEGAWIEGATDLATENLQLSRLFTTVERSNRRLAEGWQFNLPGILEQEVPRKQFHHPLKENIQLSYDEKNRLVKIATSAPFPYEAIEIFYDESSNPSCKAISHLGDSVEYSLRQLDGKNLYLTSVKKSGSPEIQYSYQRHPSERKLLLAERTVEGADKLLFDYSKEGKLRAVSRNTKDNLLFSLEYFPQKTKVLFPSGVVQEYNFSSTKLVTRIDTMTPSPQGVKRYRSQTFEWKNGKMVSKATLDAFDAPLTKEIYSYNAEGRLSQETLIGIITSQDKAPNELYSKDYLYDAQGRLIEERESNGKIKKFTYKNDSNLLTSVLAFSGNQVIERTFYTYSPLGKLEMEQHDFGIGTLTTFKNRSKHDSQGRIIEKAKGFIDPLSLEMEIEEVEYFEYDEKSRLTHHKVLDALGECLQEIDFTYDAFGKCRKSESLDLTTTFEYSNTGSIVKKQEESKGVKKITEYRLDGKPLREEEWREGALPKSQCYLYDSMERLVKKVDQFGNETEYLYDDLGRKTSEISPSILDQYGNSVRPHTQFQYDELDRLICITDAKGYSTTTKYNCRGQPLSISHADGTTEVFNYELDGRIRLSQNREGIVTLQNRDLSDQLLKETKLDRNGCYVESSLYSYSGQQLIQEEHSNGLNKHYTYDFRGRKISEIEEGGALHTVYTYNDIGMMIQKEQRWEGQKVISKWNALERTWQLMNEEGQVLLENGQAEITLPLEIESVYWHSSGLPMLQKEFREPSGVVRKCVFDALGRLILEEKLSIQGVVFITKELFYDLTGHLAKERITKIGSSRPIETLWEWGPCGRLEKVIEHNQSPRQEVTTYYYNRYGQLETILKPDGTAIEQEFNAQAMLSRIHSSDLSIDYTLYYNQKGLIEKVLNNIDRSEHIREYNRERDLISETLENGAKISYEYDALGRKTKLLLPDESSIQYTYELTFLKKVARLNSEGAELYTHLYSAYNKDGRAIEQKMIGGLGTISEETSPSGLLNKRTSPYQQETLSYDQQNRLVRRLKSDINGEHKSEYSYNDLSELQEEEGETSTSYSKPYSDTIEFDLNGNLASKRIGDTLYRYEYDALNRLKRIFKSDVLIEEYRYDAYHRRMSTTTSDQYKAYLYDGNYEIGARDKSGSITELRVLGRTKGSERDATVAVELEGHVYAVLNDTQGSISKLVTLAGNVAHDCCYNAFGLFHPTKETLTSCPWNYSGKRIDHESGLIYFGRRYLDPQLGHWISKDPLGFVDGADRRAFVKNNPLNQYDHFGLNSVSERFSRTKTSLKNLFQQAGAKILHSIRKFRETCTMGLPQTLEHLVGRGFLMLMGYCKTEPDQGAYGLGEVSDKVRVSYINGILTDYASLYSALQELSNAHGGVNIHYVYRPTKGWVWDILQSFMVKLGYISPHAHALAKEWKVMIYEMGGVDGGGTIIHYAHSIGAVETIRALSFLTPEEQKMIQVYAFGSPSLSNIKGETSFKNFVSVRDGVPLLDPWGFLKACIGSVDHVLFVGTFIGIPFVDHLFSTQSYQDLWRSMGRTFVDWYGTLI